MGFSVDLFLGKVDDTFLCGICLDVLERATSLSVCGHTFCEQCIAMAIITNPECPKCRMSVEIQKAEYVEEDDAVTTPNYIANDLIGNMTIRCHHNKNATSTSTKTNNENESRVATEHQRVDETRNIIGCQWVGKVSDLKNHLEMHCQWEEITCPISGCMHQCARKDMPSHNELRMQEHFRLTIERQVNDMVNERMISMKRDLETMMDTKIKSRVKKSLSKKLLKTEFDFRVDEKLISCMGKLEHDMDAKIATAVAAATTASGTATATRSARRRHAIRNREANNRSSSDNDDSSSESDSE